MKRKGQLHGWMDGLTQYSGDECTVGKGPYWGQRFLEEVHLY